MRRSKAGSAFGFTLVELLVVIGVIAVLIAMLLPVLNKARAQAKAAVCMSQLRQVGTAFINYAQSNKGILQTGGSTPPGFTIAWHSSYNTTTKTYDPKGGFLFPYMKNNVIHDCPAMVDSGVQSDERIAFISYGWIMPLWGKFTATPNFIRTTYVRSPAETVLMADAAQFFGSGPKDFDRDERIYAPNTRIPAFHARHNRRANVLWHDGHVSGEELNYTQSRTDKGGPVHRLKAGIGDLTPAGIVIPTGSFPSTHQANYFFWADKNLPR